MKYLLVIILCLIPFIGSTTETIKISELGTGTAVTDDDYLVYVDDPGGTPVTKKITFENFVLSLGIADLLTSLDLSTVTISGGTANTVAIWDGSQNLTGTASPAILAAEVDGHTTSTDLTAAQVSNTVIHNIGHADGVDTFLILPTAAAGYSFLVNIGEADTGHFCVEAGANDAMYLISATGTVSAGADGTAVCMMEAQVGQSFACWTFKHTDDYDWMCKAISIGTSTFEAHASSE